MKKLLLPLLLLFVLLSASCGKSDVTTDPEKSPEPNPITTPVCKILSAELYFQNKLFGSASLTYNTNGSISKIASTSDTAFTSFNVVYSNEKVVLKTKYYGDYTFTLDAQQRVIRTETNGGYFECNITYNAEGYISGVVSRSGTSTANHTFSYQNGNLKSIISKLDNGGTTTTNFIYNTDIAIEPLLNIDPLRFADIYHPLVGLFGKRSKNMLVSADVISYFGNPEIYSRRNTGYTYEKDTEGKIAKITVNEVETDNSPNRTPYIKSTNNYFFIIKYNCN